MFKEGQKLRFIKLHGSMNKHLKLLLGKNCVALGDSYSYGKTLVRFEQGPMKPTFNIANERLAIATEE